MKKILLILTILFTILLTGCFKRDAMENIDIITTIYPIEYVVKRLYGDSSNIISIYPRSAVFEDITITKKQLQDFSENNLFVYNGESNEREYATYMLNVNKKIKIIDATYSLEATNVQADVWLNPSNILMIAKNIKNELKGYISNPFIIEEINDKHEKLKLDISQLEAEFKRTGDNSKNKTIITADKALLFLEKYGFNVINLIEEIPDDEKTEAIEKYRVIDKNVSTAKNLLKNGNIQYIFVHENNSEVDIVNELVNNYGAKKAMFKTMNIISEEDLANNEDYLSIMYKNIEALKEETYK